MTVETRHTPGPWRAHQLGHERGAVGAGPYDIALTYGPNATADARLMAAAPALLDALEMMAGQYVAFVAQGAAAIHNQADREEYIMWHRAHVQRIAFDAIAQARGKA